MHRILLASLLFVAACTDPVEATRAPLAVPEGCNPLGASATGEADCLLPYPSNFYREEGSDGAHVVLPDAALPHDTKGRAVSPTTLHPADGFSPGSQLLAVFAEGVDASELVGPLDDLTLSREDSSPTLLLDDEGRRILHLAELDPRAKSEARRALVIRPLERLEEGRRYVVAIRRLRGLDGVVLPPREGFRRLRDREADGEPVFAKLGSFEADVLAPLEANGVPRGELQLAWDFTVRTRDDMTGDLLDVRARVLETLAKSPPNLKVVKVFEAPDELTARRIELTVDVPLFTEKDAPLSPLRRDDEAKLAPSGTVAVPFTVWIPKSVAERPADAPPARLMQFGHGFFGMRSEAGEAAFTLAAERGMVVMAVDWAGMSEADKAPVAERLATDLPSGLAFCDRLHQGFANALALGEAADALASLPELAFNGVPAVAPSPLYFYGISMGHILGGTYVALSPRIARAALSVGGADFSLMMFRARPFLGFLAFVQLGLPDTLDQQKFAAFAQSELDRIDPLTYAPHVLAEPLDDAPKDRRVLLQIGIGDVAVPNLGSHLHGRALGVKHLVPAPRAIAGLEDVSGPYDGSALVEFDFGISPLPGERAQPSVDDTPAHEGVRKTASGKEQIDRFFRPSGTIDAVCDGPCDPD
ncbi:MAG: hypothetical protein FJ095_17160 [Deltaproteobacteria bacterium]|nr:hypothetical protein [Deltaproteobacteria bacterium]